MKVDFLCEFDLKNSYYTNMKNWMVKQKPKISLMDEILMDDYEYEKDKDFNGWSVRNTTSKQYFQHLKITAKNEKDYGLQEYASLCLYAFNKQFKNQKEVDKYFGR